MSGAVLQFREAARVVIRVRFDRIYGLVKCYPVSDAAQRLCSLTGKKTLSPSDLASAGALGLPVEAVDVQMLADFMAGRL